MATTTTTGPVRSTVRIARTYGTSALPARTALTVTGTSRTTATAALCAFPTKDKALSWCEL